MRIESQPLRSTLEHVALPPRQGSRFRPPLLVLLHGRGADEHDLIPVTHYLDARFYIVSVRAPFRFPYGGNTWYDIMDEAKPDPKMFSESFQKLESFIQDAVSFYPVAQGPFYLFGFSMGAMMALSYTMHHPELVRGVAAHSGYLPPETNGTYRWGDVGNTSIFLAHGSNDGIVPVRLARSTQDLFQRSTADFTYREYPIQHNISEDSIADIDGWFKRLLGPVGKV